MVSVPISPPVLRWARDFRGLDIEKAADKLGIPIDELLSYESGQQEPTLTMFDKFASVYRLPQATLFRRTKPQEPPLPQDFRTFEGAPPRLGFEFSVSLSEVRYFQKILRDLSKEDEEFTFANLPIHSRHKDPWVQGEEERKRIGVSVEEQLGWRSDEGFRRWRAVLENNGIAVYLQKFDLKNCRGYSLFEENYPPAIVINKEETFEKARTFTLIHEFAHLLIRQPGISDQNNKNPVEAFCNRFAAGFLMPTDALRAVLSFWPNKPVRWEREYIRKCASRLKVSQQALALRLEELGFAPPGYFKMFAWKGAVTRKQGGSSGGNYVATRLNEIGGRYASAVIGALDRRVIDSVHASEALGLSTKHFEMARNSVKRQRASAGAG